MKILPRDLITAQKLINKYTNIPIVASMNNYIQHGSVTTLQHCINVAIISMIIVKYFSIKVNEKDLIEGAMLHDFYLYDWHDGRMREEGLHGFSHPKVAACNAKKYLNVNDKVENIITSHMFPLTITKVPKSKEAIIVSVADKICAIKESLHFNIYKIKSKSFSFG